MDHLISAKTDYSIGESLVQVGALTDKAAELGYKSVALADIMTVSSMVSFSNKAKAKGLKPIIGVTLRVYNDPLYRPPGKSTGDKGIPNPMFMPKVYAKSDKGMKSILATLSIGHSKDYFYYHARIGLNELLAMEDVIVTTGDQFGLFYHPNHDAILDELNMRFKEDLLVEIVPIHTPLYDTMNRKALAMAEILDIKTVGSYPSLYARNDQAPSLDVYRAVIAGNKMKDGWTLHHFTTDFSMNEPKHLAKRLLQMFMRLDRSDVATCLPKVKSVVRNQSYIAENTAYIFEKQKPCLPVMAPDEFAQLSLNVRDGWNKRFNRPVLGHQPSPAELLVYKDRLIYELKVLHKMGFSNYFLLTQDIVNWAKSQGIIVGPGRGSVGGSLVAYLLGITDVDPIRFNLLFERFINPERIDLPDADLDFQSTRRHEVLKYIVDKYGEDYVAGVSNYSTLASASALRDAGRVHEIDLFEMNCTKLVPKEHGNPVSLTEAAEAVPEIDKFKNHRPEVWAHALNLEGVMRGLSQHAAGIIVAGEPLINRAVVETRTGGPVVNWDKSIVEDFGLIKMDILGLSTLDVMGLAAQYIKERHGINVNYTKLPLDEPDVMEAFGRGETVGVFQFESSGMRRLLKDLATMEPLTFEEISAATALYRPGPMDSGLMDEYVQIKKGLKPPFYEHPSIEASLKNTFGVIVYQEQVMQVAQFLSGFSLAEADRLRKAMGKKDPIEMAKYKDAFVKGAVANGMDEADAIYLWDKIELFAGYAFNRSHSVEYSVISYWAMWLKVRYPNEFYAASMTVADDDDKLAALLLDAKGKKIEVLPPDINYSSSRIEIDNDGRLYAPFQAVKGISENVANNIMKVRQFRVDGIKDDKGEWIVAPQTNTHFTNSAEFNEYITLAKLGSKINKSHKEKLERVGAFARIDNSKIPARHPDRVKDQVELMPGFVSESVKADRPVANDKLSMIKIVRMSEDVRDCKGCSLQGGVHVMPRMGKSPKFMVVFDAPNNREEREGKMLDTDAQDILKALFAEMGGVLSVHDGYYTSLVKSPKSDKMLTNEQINGCSGYLMREIEILKPPVIVTLGAAAQRFFAPSLKGGGAELAGKVIYRPDLDASIVFGINPQQLYFDPSKVKLLENCFKQVQDIIT